VTCFPLLLAVLAQAQPRPYPAALVDCYDADTCRLDIHLGLGLVMTDQPVRLCDIDAPEMRVLEQKAAAIVARDWLLGQLRATPTIEVQVSQKRTCVASRGVCDQRDKYGRWLVYLVAGGVNLNRRLVELGYAKPYVEECR
jgi:endonuclease YncB( thermonuclease family)